MEIANKWAPHQGYERSILLFYREAHKRYEKKKDKRWDVVIRLSKFGDSKRGLSDAEAAVRAMETAVSSANTGLQPICIL